MHFGNTLSRIVPGIIAMLMIGVLLAVLLTFVSIKHETTDRLLVILPVAVFGLPSVFIIAVLPTLLFSIEIADGRVKHLFLNRFILSDFALCDYRSISAQSGIFGAVIRFRGGRKIHFLGAHMGILNALEEALESDDDTEGANK